MQQKKSENEDNEKSLSIIESVKFLTFFKRLFLKISKALTRRSCWTDKDELLDIVYWGRQILSLVIGLLWGLIPLKGFVALVLYIGISTIIGHLYLTWYQEKDDEDFGGFWEVAKEGFGAAFATFMVSWVTAYSASQFE